MIALNSMILSLVFQYAIGRKLGAEFHVWTKDAACDRDACVAQQGVFRVALAQVCFFGLMAIGSRLSKQFHNALWPFKFALAYIPLVVGMLFVPAPAIDQFVWAARAGAAIFVVLQMIVIVDLAYAVNDWFVAQSNADGYAAVAAYARGQEDFGDGPIAWMQSACAGLDEALTTLLSIALFLFAVAITGNVLLFVYYAECATTTAFVAMTLVLCVAATATQLALSESGNLLTSAAVSAYAVFVAYTAVSRDPDERCNPFARDRDILGIVCGLGLALVSLAWTAHASSAGIADMLDDGGDAMSSAASSRDLGRELVPRASSMERGDDDDDDDARASSTSAVPPPPIECLDGGDAESIRLNVVLALVACYVACSLTNWGTWDTAGGAGLEAPLAGRVSSWLNIAAQWVMMCLYFWTLVAPLIFPDREFG